ncbi:MAG: hypothetical protein ABI723_01235 [Bacteroidia bacterium]
MLKIFKHFTFIFFIFFWDCNHKEARENFYPNNPEFSKSNGEPFDLSTSYFLKIIMPDTLNIDLKNDSIRDEMYSRILYSSKELIYYNYYLGHDVYRFLWIRALDVPVIFSIHNKNGNVWLEVKIPRSVTEEDGKSKSYYYESKDSSLVKYGAINTSDFALNQKRNLSIKEWNTFETLLKETDFLNIPSYNIVDGFDGSSWIIEAHLKDNYKVVERWNPENDFKKCGEYLITLSGLQEEIY